MKLISLPDAKMFHKNLTLGKDYEVVRTFGNGSVIMTDDDTDGNKGFEIILLTERLSND